MEPKKASKGAGGRWRHDHGVGLYLVTPDRLPEDVEAQLEKLRQTVNVSIQRKRDALEQDMDTDKYIDAKIEASELRIDARMVRLEGRIDHVEGKIDALSQRLDDKFASLVAMIEEMRRNMLTPTQALIGAFTLFIGIVGTMIGILAYGGDRQDAGYGIGAAVEARVSATEKNFAEVKSDMDQIKQQLQAIQTSLAPPPAPPPSPKQ